MIATRGRRAMVTALVGACALATVTACSSDSGSSAGGSSVLTIQGDAGNPTLVENFNPLMSSNALHGVNLIYEPLEIVSPIDGSFTPFLATSHKFINSTTLTFTLRSGVKWSDGTPFTAQDVVFTFNLLKKFPALDGTGVWQHLSSISASGSTVTMKFSSPSVPAAAIVAAVPIVPQHIWSKIADPTKFTNTKPVGTGPFTLQSFAPTEYTLVKNPTYWQASKIAPTEVKFPAQASSQSANQLQVTSGAFDWAYNYLPDVQKTYVDRDPKQNTYWFPPGGTIGLYLNLTKSPYSNADFRKGISLALDRTTIAKKAVNGYLDQASMSGLILPNLQKWLDPSLPNKGLITQSVSAAMASFAQAGYTMKGGKLVGSDGKQVTMTISMPNNFSDWVAAATEVSTELKAVGIQVNLDEPQFAQYQTEIQSGSFDAAIGGFGGSGSPYTDFNNALNSQFAAPLKTATANNFERFKDPAVDSALNTLAGATDEAAQQKATYALEQAMYEQTPVVLLYYGGSWGLFSTKNFTGWPSASNPYTLPTNYNQSLLMVVTHLTKS
ncbi:ABC transporter substrate-binding protein [Rudaeicoccus suwonensis]|uniref:Peptide/nickel transport system substrate-binding protein n=1 Tax=Rudaeicoccus suwonensis TaxID=657409 RepID=A0A561E7Y3_9MICO|nr:ABC transporter substrate-binding protein [Rudaeicoccus suwonensis]TWE11721.1 peptide/nickel transport system substrate-binding protein [Rudaeicoccus suwonensis]